MRCFIIQPFSDPYNGRYDEIYAIAVREAGFDPYRVDQDPAATIPIDQIESGIREAACCLADISEDNPNVWFELGYAISAARPLCLISAKERRTRLPFDLQHRHTILYGSATLGDFKRLKLAITERLLAIRRQIEVEGAIASVQTSVQSAEATLDHHEISCLALIAGEALSTDETVSFSSIRDSMSRAGFTPQATALALHQLKRHRLVTIEREQDYNGNDYSVCRVTDEGMDTLTSLSSSLRLTEPARSKPRSGFGQPREKFPEDLDDEIPF